MNLNFEINDDSGWMELHSGLDFSIDEGECVDASCSGMKTYVPEWRNILYSMLISILN